MDQSSDWHSIAAIVFSLLSLAINVVAFWRTYRMGTRRP